MKKLLCTILCLTTIPLHAANPPPRLIVQLVVDQLRGDLLYQYQDKFGANGFNYLLNHSINYQNAHHPHAHTVTCVGHATIATGSYPMLHGVVANDWFDPMQGKSTYCMADRNSKILPIHPSDKDSEGRSPAHLLASTLSDELILAKRGRAFGVSFKDRAAITMAGHAGKAFWFDKHNGGFITSNYYYQHYPQWVQKWNQGYQPANRTWALKNPARDYNYADAPRFEHRFPGFGQKFPHHLGEPSTPKYLKYLSMTPFADELTTDFAIELLRAEQLGAVPGKTDYLSISFSATDAIGHQFGPNSLESEDNLLRLDETIARLLAVIDQQVGLANTLVILTADHGVSDSTVYLAAHHLYENHSLKEQKLRHVLDAALGQHFQLPADAVRHIELPYVYLNHQIIKEHQLSVGTVTTYLVEILRQLPGVFQAYPMPLAATEHDWLSAKVDKMAFPGRSGDLYIVPPPYQALADKSEQRTSHGTPWNYDSYVPLLFVHPGIKPRRIAKPAYTTDIASTLATILKIKAPSANVGQPLPEVTNHFE
ncbi:alkaline phosphatase family protein [Legionella spiritensis]|uniref:alkaline phosphatase family protein n=1 Tax=Legionella spiritensis TaxID=452 RepID=UPI000F710CD7|nr:alkaline phosphatase family protein [Legionella spiritensis]VEG92353.1 alkaline phosphatase [Legionella spiritensis]